MDDLLPVDKYGHPICSFSNTKNELWVRQLTASLPDRYVHIPHTPARPSFLFLAHGDGYCPQVSIIEKAYMKVNGGYDFPGSNSGIDLFCLTGWLPEHMQFNSKDFDKEVHHTLHVACFFSDFSHPLPHTPSFSARGSAFSVEPSMVTASSRLPPAKCRWPTRSDLALCKRAYPRCSTTAALKLRVLTLTCLRCLPRVHHHLPGTHTPCWMCARRMV